MVILDISIQYRVIIGISAMVLLFSSFLIAFISSQRKKLQYHKDLANIHEEQQKALKEQNSLLEQRVEERTSELVHQKENLQVALAELKLSQMKLIQKEKMASLGEFTSGVAHEIQNPLNFVNNFAEINSELLAEIKERLNEDSESDALRNDLKPIIEDLAENSTKIHQHGKKADKIVKSMLQHSRKQVGDMELVDINEMAKEYLNLSFHGFKAKNKNYSCSFETELDDTLQKINLVPQDIGTILLNIYDNAFYATRVKKKIKGDDYIPVVKVSTRINQNKLVLTIRDNGIGIPQQLIDKIFQPFFTTKPTGEGTGLGLSLSYDIIKAHQGELRVTSKEDEFSEFTIELNY